MRISGCGAIGSALALGARGCRFESGHPDHLARKLHRTGRWRAILRKRWSMKRLFLITLFSYSLTAQPLAQNASTNCTPCDQYQEQAQEWTERVVTKVDRYFINDLLELLHASYTRSYMTLVIQDTYPKLMEHIGSGWNHIISTRLNPSKDTDFDTSTLAIDQTMQKQLHSFQQTCNAYTAYAKLVNRLVDDTHPAYPARDTTLNYKPCRKLIDELRENARAVVAETLIETIDEIQEKVKKAQEMISQAAELFKSQGQLKSPAFPNRSITELLWYYLPNTMVKSFVNFDAGYTTGSKECLSAYLESQQLGNAIWQRIELARARFYAAYYQALYTALAKTLPQMLPAQHPSELVQQLADYSC